jgi:hypothetical protein
MEIAVGEGKPATGRGSAYQRNAKKFSGSEGEKETGKELILVAASGDMEMFLAAASRRKRGKGDALQYLAKKFQLSASIFWTLTLSGGSRSTAEIIRHGILSVNPPRNENGRCLLSFLFHVAKL